MKVIESMFQVFKLTFSDSWREVCLLYEENVLRYPGCQSEGKNPCT